MLPAKVMGPAGALTTCDNWSHVGLPAREPQLRRGFVGSVAAAVVVILGLFFGLTRYTELADNATEEVERFYKYFIDVQIMVYIGFGFLMTFLRRYSYSAVCLNFFASAFMFLEAILMVGATQQVFWSPKHTKIQVDMALLIDCAFCSASGMIAFGAIIGKSTPTQTLWLLFWQVPLYALNQRLVIHTFKALDMGGTIVIHMLGAYYGLAASYMLSRRQPMHGLDNPKNSSSYLNDVFSMIGTIFLFIYWPSFNGALASVPHATLLTATDAAKSSQFLCIVNTLLSLLGAVLAAFAASALVGGRLNMVHVQNSTLAGGVAMGAACTLRMTPGGALAVGLGAGALSTLGYQFLTPFLDRTIGLGDTCGVHNLHGMPSILGALVAGLAALGQHSEYLMHPNGRTQLGYQVLASVVTIGIAVSGGLLGGWLASWLNPGRHEELTVPELFDDGAWWMHTRVEALPVSASIHLANNSAHNHHNQHHINMHNLNMSVGKAMQLANDNNASGTTCTTLPHHSAREGTTHRGTNRSVNAGASLRGRDGMEPAAAHAAVAGNTGHVSVIMDPSGVNTGSSAAGAAAAGYAPHAHHPAAEMTAMGMAVMAPMALEVAGAADAPLFGPGVPVDAAVRPVPPVGVAGARVGTA